MILSITIVYNSYTTVVCCYHMYKYYYFSRDFSREYSMLTPLNMDMLHKCLYSMSYKIICSFAAVDIEYYTQSLLCSEKKTVKNKKWSYKNV